MNNRSLSQRFRRVNAALIGTVFVLCAAAITSLVVLRFGTEQAIEEYREMMMLKHAEQLLQRAELLLRLDTVRPDSIRAQLEGIRTNLTGFVDAHAEEEHEEGAEARRERAELQAVRITLDRVNTLMGAIEENTKTIADREAVARVLAGERDRLHGLAVDPNLDRVERQTSRAAWAGVLVVGALSLLMITMTVVLSRSLHRRIVGSIHRLQTGARQIARGHFSRRVDEHGDEEIVALARDFNKMTVQLETLYRDMERRIEHKSRELVRSERLASVGFLAAGVAHEINNPLGIINGYATMARDWLAGTPDREQIDESAEACRIISEEAFRCKQIVEQLVTLSMIGDGSRDPVSLRRVVEELVVLVQGLERSKTRTIVFEQDPGDDPEEQYMVSANAVELKQVVLNLIVNAIDATDDHTGQITIGLRRSGERIFLSVKDNGHGIEQGKIHNVFEPFFSGHSNGENHRLGLGLTISHAIVEAHGGRISVHSEGEGRGTRFVVEFPAEVAAESICEQ